MRRIFTRATVIACALNSYQVFANPYEDPTMVPKDSIDWNAQKSTNQQRPLTENEIFVKSVEVIRVDVDWHPADDTFSIGRISRENSGTAALLARAPHRDPHGSYQATLRGSGDDAPVFHDSLGTGKEFRRLSRGLSFRFPVTGRTATFTLTAENPLSGVMEVVLSETIDTGVALRTYFDAKRMEVRRLKEATESPAAILNIYAEGYLADESDAFWSHAQRVPAVFEMYNMPMLAHLEINAIFAPSNEPLGAAEDLGPDPIERDSFLGLYFPHWNNFGRWYHVIYPTNYKKYRDGLASAPYDYAVTIVNSSDYWGVGNFKEHTAVPSGSSSFGFLLMHELGHYFGLNEEYNGGGRTELEFAPGIEEPWSQNITFQTARAEIKWQSRIDTNTSVPTPTREWENARIGPWGAYTGGYADSEPINTAKRPALACTMNRADRFCAVCLDAIRGRIKHDIGLDPL